MKPKQHDTKLSALPSVHLKAGRAFKHPWIFSKMVAFPLQRLSAGTIVEIRGKDDAFVGWGTWHPEQMIALRVLSESRDQPITEAFIRRRLERAKKLREDILDIPAISDSYRLIHAEADGLGGIIIDKLGAVLVIEPFSAGIITLGPWLVSVLKNLYPDCRAGIKPAPKVEAREGVSLAALIASYPLPAKTIVNENGLRYEIDFATGHKTGFFLDQRENRFAVSQLARNATVFDICCYTGGFALSALQGGAARVCGVDLDEKALVVAHNNARLNNFPRTGQQLEFIHQNAFDFLRKAIDERQTANMVIVDPAKLASVKDEIPRALRTYGDLNKLAIQVVKHGGILVTCSCSGLVSEETFRSVVCRAAQEAGRTLQFFNSTGAGPDHPVSSDFPEGRYLKVLFARVFNQGV